MKEIMTVRGWQNPLSLGFCQPHEHLMISSGISSTLYPALCIDDIDKSVEEVLSYKKAGGKTIIDAQPGGCNRVEGALLEISEKTNIHIIASTGFHKHIFYPKTHWIFHASLETLKDFFIHELTIGMYTDINQNLTDAYLPIRAGQIKAALDTEGLTPVYQKCFHAAAQAAVICDVPFMVHIEQGSVPLNLLDKLLAWNVPANRIIFCHLDRKIMPLSYYTDVLEQGIALEFDTIGRFKYHSDEEEATLIMKLLDLGFENQLLISLDTTRERLRSYNRAGIGLDYLFTSFLSLLRQHGVTKQQIKKITQDNIIRIFT